MIQQVVPMPSVMQTAQFDMVEADHDTRDLGHDTRTPTTVHATRAPGHASGHMKCWYSFAPSDNWVSLGVFRDGYYGTTEGVMFSFPITITGVVYNMFHEDPGAEGSGPLLSWYW